MNGTPTPGEAQDLLNRAQAIESSVTAGMSWPYVLTLLGIGVVSSMSVAAFWLARHLGPGFIHYPLWLMITWTIVFLVVGIGGARGAKRGFGRRWVASIGLWAVLWVAAMVAPGPLGDPLWFSVLMSVLLAVATIGCALWELRR